ncbi:TetR/AcrR family transcriptional regulator [Frankia sp. AgB1.9]|uniref:TetR/AcrR family transcriptional regulator n=1 Tax=unclassified Frankia TaxID=2632575 RepID=UPI001934053B|nr:MULTISPECIES: TetR/AcrR family transcriptional regulator [unclassified Frankia]MBL7491019.1 TetR/AcrR family transcriptional regulator [Frankia sp. AgW1.1]MBL7548160.1 TetR/AcrR family transcriptional regulator [Frankia sp. AgB1.9]MBL7620386.1 TetR/AcrR family transcriptional regulator [Frankia sp. AgB1.8]
MASTDNVSPPAPVPGARSEGRDKASGPRSRKGAATRARLVQAAKAVFEEDGFLDARISDIAEHAGLSHGSFYHYFDSKEQIFREVAMAVGDLLQQPMYTSVFNGPSARTPAATIRQVATQFLASYRDEARIIGVIEMVSRYDPELTSIRFEYQEADRIRAAKAVRRMQEQGWADPSIIPEVALAAMSAMMNRFAEMWFVQKLFEFDFDEGVEQLVRLCLNALQLEEPAADLNGR